MKSVLRTFVMGGVLGAGVVGGGALALAQTGTSVPPATEVPGTAPGTTEPPVTAPGTTAPPADGRAPGGADRKGDRPGKGHRKGGHGRGHGGGLHLHRGGEELAAELGVTVEQLRDARQAAAEVVRQQLGEPTKPRRPLTEEDRTRLTDELKQRAELFNRTLAEKLGVTTERLRDARVAVVSRHLDEAVAAGRLTREQADKILAEARDGLDGDLRGLGKLGRGPGRPAEPGR